MFNFLFLCAVGQAESTSLMAVADLQGEIERLQYRECRRMVIQGHITAVQYHHWPEEEVPSGVNATPHKSQRSQQVYISAAF